MYKDSNDQGRFADADAADTAQAIWQIASAEAGQGKLVMVVPLNDDGSLQAPAPPSQ
jgi:hypothetical protein